MKLKPNIFLGIIWNPAISFESEILELINDRYEIVTVNRYNFNNKKDFKNSIKDIYRCDATAGRKYVKTKVRRLLKYNFSYTVFLLKDENSEIINIKDKKDRCHLKSINMIKIKNHIRDLYKNKIDDNLRYEVIHLCDIPNQSSKTL